MTTPKQVGFCIKCGASFATMRAFKKHIKECKRKLPNNLEECIEQLEIQNSGNKELSEWLRLPNEEASGIVHFSSGMWMRNNWGLWDIKSPLNKWFNSIGISHADDMSSIISASFHRRMNGKPILLEQQVKFYQNYWKKEGYEDGIPK